MKLLLYCDKTKPYLNCDFGKDNHEEYSGDWNIYLANKQDECSNIVNGKIVAECDFEVEEIMIGKSITVGFGEVTFISTPTLQLYDLSNNSCLSGKEIENYLGDKKGYAIHIKNLHIFDEPNELFFYDGKSKEGVFYHLYKTPKNVMYVYDFDELKCILIPVKPEDLCKILNGEQTILVRRKLLKEML